MSTDDERESQVSDMDMGDIEPTAPHLEHWVVRHDQKWDYEGIANSLYDGEKVLVQSEKLSSNHHVHFQGYTSLAPRTFGDRMTELFKTHYMKEFNPKCRPGHRAHRGIDEKGFQYLMKEGHQPVYQRGFTQEELDQLAEASKEHVKKMKESLRDWVRDLNLKPTAFDDPEHLYNQILLKVDKEYLRVRDKAPSRHTRVDVAQGLRLHQYATDRFILWLHANNKF